MQIYYRPLIRFEQTRPTGAFPFGQGWFSEIEVMQRQGPSHLMAAVDAPADILRHLISPRDAIAGLDLTHPRLMGIVNVTPDSFSDGGQFQDPATARDHALSMARAGADILDIGGESTRPGAVTVPTEEEINRTAPVIGAICDGCETPVSIDTRKAPVAQAALDAGARIVNDVAALTFDPDLAAVTAQADVPVCVMHAQGDPATMQADPRYDDVLFDVYDFLNARIDAAVAAGVGRDKIIVDPGIGFGKTLAHNLRLLQNISLFHTLGCPILLGASRKRFIGTLSQTANAADRAPGSIAVALAAVAQGVQILRVHDIKETRQALTLWQAITGEVE